MAHSDPHIRRAYMNYVYVTLKRYPALINGAQIDYVLRGPRGLRDLFTRDEFYKTAYAAFTGTASGDDKLIEIQKTLKIPLSYWDFWRGYMDTKNPEKQRHFLEFNKRENISDTNILLEINPDKKGEITSHIDITLTHVGRVLPLDNTLILSPLEIINRFTTDLETALWAINNAIELLPDPSYEYFHLRGRCKYFTHNYDDANEDFTRANNLNPNDAANNLWLGKVNYQIAQLDQAIDNFTKAIFHSSQQHITADAYCSRGVCKYLSSKHKNKSALADLDKAIKLEEDNYIFLFTRGVIHKNLENYQEAQEDFSSCININPKFKKAHMYRGEIKMIDRNYKGAIDDFRVEIDLNPENVEVMFLYAEANKGIDDVLCEMFWYSQAISCNPDNHIGFLKRALLHVKVEKYKNAIRDFSICIEINGMDSNYLYQRSYCRYKLKQYTKALIDINKALRLVQNYENYKLRSQIKETMNNEIEAKKDYEKAKDFLEKEIASWDRPHKF